MATTIRVLVADNHPTFCAGIRTILTTVDDLEMVGEAYNLQQLRALQTENSPHILLIAANLVADSLLDQVAAWKQKFANSKLLVMLAQADEACLRQLTGKGADGVILKTEPTDKFIQAIRLIAQGELWVSQPLLQKIIQSEATLISFTESEKAVLPFIIAEITLEEIAQVLHLSDRTLKRHLQEIYAKLGVKTLRGAAVPITRLGLA